MSSKQKISVDKELKSETICRLCASKGKKYKNLLEPDRWRILKLIIKLFGFQISGSDELHYICLRCDTKLEDFNKFCKEIENSQKIFDQLKNQDIKQIKVEIPDEQSSDVKVEVETFLENTSQYFPPLSSNVQITFNDDDEHESDHDSNHCSVNKASPKPEKNNFKKSKSTKGIDRDKQINQFFDFTCSNCLLKFCDWRAYRQHIIQEHSDTQSLTISCCDTELPLVRKPLLTHVEYHTNPDKLQCKWCGKQFVNIDSKRVHEWRHKTTQERGTRRDGSQKIQCLQCGKILADKFSHNKHMQIHMSNEEREKLKVQCDLCKKFFRDKNAVAIHIRDIHIPKQESIACDKCAKVFNSTRTFYTHYRTNHMIVHRVACPDCGVEMKANNLRKHKKLKHDHQAQTCTICSKVFRNRASLMIHKRRIHIEPKFSCDVCGKLFKVRDKWKEHREGHFISNRFSCDQCDYVNNDYANMLKHRKVKHADVPPLPPGTGRKVFEARLITGEFLTNF